jgi:hypothetical protein
VNYLFGIHKRNAPVYSFVNSVKPRERALRTPARGTVAARAKQAEAQQKKNEEAARARAQQDESRKRAAADAELKKKQAQADADARRQAALAKKEKTSPPLRPEAQKQIATEEVPGQKESNQKGVIDEAQKEDVVSRQTEPENQVVIQPSQPEKTEPASQELVEAPIDQNHGDGSVQSGGQQPVAVPQNVPEGNPEHEQAQFERLEANADDPLRPVEQVTVDPVRHEIVKRGDHPQELDVAEYVIVGVFKSPDNAQHFSNGLRSLDFRTRYGRVTEKDLWYVYILKTSDAARAKAEQARISKLFLLRDAWLLTVEP